MNNPYPVNIAELNAVAKDRGIFFDTETGGLLKKHRIYSYASLPYNAKSGSLNAKYLSNPDMSKWSVYSKQGYSEVLNQFNKDNIKSSQFTSSISESLMSDIVPHLKGGGLIIGHNIGFDLAAISQELPEETVSELRAAFGVTKGKLSTAVRLNRSKINHEGYRSYISKINQRLKVGKVAVVDTRDLAQYAFSILEEKNILTDFKGDYITGTKMNFFGAALGLGEQLHDASDVALNKHVYDFLTSSLHELDTQGTLRDNRLDVFKKIASQQTTWAHQSVDNSLLDMAFNKVKREEKGKKRLYAVPGGTKKKNIKGKQIYMDTLDEVFASNKFGGIKRTKYGYTNAEYTSRFNRFENEVRQMRNAGQSFGDIEVEILNRNKKAEDRIIKSIAGSSGTAAMDGFGWISRNKKWLKPAGITASIVGAAMLYSELSSGYNAPPPGRISSKDDTYNTIEGLHPGGGVNKTNIQSMTDFGSGWNGKYTAFTLGAFVGAAKKYADKKNGEEDKRNGLVNFALSFADDAAILGINAYLKRAKTQNQTLLKIKNILNSDKMQYAMAAFGGYSAGELLVGLLPVSNRISAKDDSYNTIEGLHPNAGPGSVNKFNIKKMTDFGSGYQGPNPQLNPSYNEAEDIYRYQMVRASKIGLSDADLYKYMTEEDKEPSEYVAASAQAGTALHQYLQAQELTNGTASNAEVLTVNYQHGISGHMDIKTAQGIGDYKTVSGGIFNAIQREGKPKPQHVAQMQFYLGNTGTERGYLQYISRDNLKQQKTFIVNYNPRQYESLIAKVERTRARVENDIARGILDKSSLPKTAGLETLQAYEKDKPSLEEMALQLDENRKIFSEEMSYLRTIKRGMPTSGEGYRRIKEKREQGMTSTQGIGLQIWSQHNQHHLM